MSVDLGTKHPLSEAFVSVDLGTKHPLSEAFVSVDLGIKHPLSEAFVSVSPVGLLSIALKALESKSGRFDSPAL